LSDHEPSYYEIALTNRQVLVAFVILLCCVLAAFFAGVWVGRGDQRPTTAVAEVPAEGAQASLDGAEEFEFFNDGGRAPANPPDPAPAVAPRETTLAEDLARPSTPADEPQPTPPTRPVVEAEDDPPPAAPADEPAAERPAPASPEGGAMVIQVFSSRDEAQAERLVTRMKAAGFPAFLSPVEVQRQPMYRVRVGPFEDRPRAEEVATRVRREFKVDTWITGAAD
jgi:cell division septation protein DedD